MLKELIGHGIDASNNINEKARDSENNEQVTKVSSPGISQTSADLQLSTVSADGAVSTEIKDYSHLWEPLYKNPWLKNHAFKRKLKKNSKQHQIAQIFNKDFSSPTLIGIWTVFPLPAILFNPSYKLFEPCSTPHNSNIFNDYS